MIIITGALGFIGYNILKKLNQNGVTEIIIVENIKQTKSLDIKLKRLKSVRFMDIVDRWDIEKVLNRRIECIFHQGACTNTMENNFEYVLTSNYEFTKKLIDWCVGNRVKMIYASSASVYGDVKIPVDEDSSLNPLNYYAYSKFLVDNYFINISRCNKTRIVGLRYFNVYGPHEENKGDMSSVVFKFFHQNKNKGKVLLFEGSQNFRRDFIHVDDIVKINLFFFENEHEGIFNCGSGRSETFFNVAQMVIKYMGYGKIQYIKFPSKLVNRYQAFTQANNSKLVSITGMSFVTLEQGIKEYIDYLSKQSGNE
ncbi:MAG: ADP-glyceromanno-heptose 6-epimerase [bacterium]